MKKIFITRKIPDAGIMALRQAGHEVSVIQKDGVLTKEELITALQQDTYDAVLCLLTDTIDGEVFDAVPTAKIFANYAVGFDNIVLADAQSRGVTITNTPGVLAQSVAEFTLSLMCASLKRIPEADRFTRAGKYTGWSPELLLGTEFYGKTLGILGTGRIGSLVAAMAVHGFGMRVLYYDVARNESLEQDTGAVYVATPDELYPLADVVSVHVPLLPSTRHLIGTPQFQAMKKTAHLINTSRGAVLDEQALLVALQNGDIAGAALDVYEHEPHITAGLEKLENVILAPHIASATHEARDAMSKLAAENILTFFEGETPPNKIQ